MARMVLQLQKSIGRVNPNIYGHFIEHLGECTYGGIWVGQDSSIPNTGGIRTDVVDALKRIKPAVLRWPGGCFADAYHWRDGVGPREKRPRRVNDYWGQVADSNEFGTDEFVRFCRLIGAEPYICGNVGSGSPAEMHDWLEYCNYPGGTSLSEMRAEGGSPEPHAVRYWGVGNENWGCGGNLTPEDYCSEYRRFATFMPALGGTAPVLIACGPSGNNTDWTRRFFNKLCDGEFPCRPLPQGFAPHYYTNAAGTDVEFSDDKWYETLHTAAGIETLIVEQHALINGAGAARPIGLVIDEWGLWHSNASLELDDRPLLWQQNTMRDALAAALTLNIFNAHADKVIMANISQTVNVLHALVLTDGAKMLRTPTYHVYEMYSDHQGGASVAVDVEQDATGFSAGGDGREMFSLQASASLKEKRLVLTVVNAHISDAIEATIELAGGAEATAGLVEELSHDDVHAHNTFEEPDVVSPRRGEKEVRGKQFEVSFGPASVTKIALDLR